MFRGINNVTLDAKGRFAVPVRYRQTLGNSLVVTIDTDEKCLLMYPASEWQIIEEKLQKLPGFNPATRRIQRLLIGHATDIELDGSSRILLPGMLREYAGLNGNLMMIGQGNKFELWAEETWESMREQWLRDEEGLADSLSDVMKDFSL